MLSRNKSVIGFVVELTRAAENMQPRSSNRNLIRNADPEDTDTAMADCFSDGERLSITHNFRPDHGAQPDISEAGQAAPHDSVSRRRIIGAREVSA
jgi:hypothetical protein